MHHDPAVQPTSPQVAPPAGRSTATFLIRVARWLVLFAYAIAIIALVVLTIAFFLRLFGANTSAPFVKWIYRSEARFMQPILGPNEQAANGLVVLFGILMYGLFAVAVHALVEWLDRKLVLAGQPRPPVGNQPQPGY